MDRDTMLSYGIDCDKGLKNCMGSLPFYKKILSMFLQDACFSRARAAFEAGDQQALFSCMHELKGVSGNAALTGLYSALLPLVELLRPGNAAPAEVARLFSAAEGAYRRTCEGADLFLRGW